MLKRIREYFATIFDMSSSGGLLFCSALVGIVAGLGAAVFYAGLVKFQKLVLADVVGYVPPSAGIERIAGPVQLPQHWWLTLLVPTLGGLACGVLVYTFAPEAEGHGTDAIVKSFHRLRGKIRARIPFVKTIASIITIGTGGSAGREGPIAQIGAGFGSFLADRLKLTDHDRRLLMLSGAAGGIGAIFRAPLGGALFLSEVLYGSTAMETSAVIPNFIASITAYMVFTQIFGTGLAITTPPDLTFHGFTEIPFYLVLAILCALVGYFYVVVFYGVRDRLFRPMPIPLIFKPTVGGLLLGGLAIALPQVMAGGYGWIQMAIDGKLSLGLMVVLCFGKIFATAFTISSGGSGGVFAPSLFVGAMLGGAFGAAAEQFFPEAIVHPEAFALVGMGGLFAGVARVPLTAMLMVCEMTGSYNLLIPLMLVCIVNFAVLAPRWSLYEEQVLDLADSPAHQGERGL